MDPSSKQWQSLGEPASTAEAAALEALRALLPDDAVTHAWSNVTFMDLNGRIAETDVILLTRTGLYVVELKGWGDGGGTISGNQQTWSVEFASGYVRHERNPVFATDLKAKRLKSLLQSHAGPGAGKLPYVGALVVLHGKGVKVTLDETARANVVALDGFQVKGVEQRFSDFLTTLPSHPGAIVDGPTATRLVKLLLRAGFQPTPKNRMVGQYSLEKADPLGQGPHWQDLLAAHPSVKGVYRRVRLFDMGPGASSEDREQVALAARREFVFTHGIDHPGIAAPLDHVESDLGPALIFDYDETEVPLVDFLRERGTTLSLDDRLNLVRQLADTLKYAHSRRLVHRGLTPAQVHVRTKDDKPRVVVRDWQTGRVTQGTRSTTAAPTPTATSFGTQDVREMLAPEDWIYLAPESHLGVADAPPFPLDVYGLGAISYLILTGEHPASSLAELQQRLEGNGHLDPLVADPTLPEEFAEVVRAATARVEPDRLSSVDDFLELLDDAEERFTAPSVEAEDDRRHAKDPLDATRGEFVADRFEVLDRRGTGSTGTALLVRDYERDEKDDKGLILKIAKDDAAARRLHDEAEVLRSLDSPRIVSLVEGPIEVDGRTALLLSDAGAQTLASHLESRGRATLQELERFGRDLLEAVAYLDAHGVFHRDIKPANLGVRPDPGTRRPSLVLFDFSLAREPLDRLASGTRGYMDPYMQLPAPGARPRRRYDRAAELYAVAVTLYEMATLELPFWSDGGLAPISATDRVFVTQDRFEASVAPQLAAFFERALAPQPSERFGDIESMARAWQEIFVSVDAEAEDPEDEAARDEQADRATLDTPLSEAGFSPRALSALSRLQARTVGELISTPPVHINSIPGLGERHRKEIQRRVRAWRSRLASADATAAQPAPGEDKSLESLLSACVPRRTSKNTTEVATLRLLLGLPLVAAGEAPEGDAVRRAESARDSWGPWPSATAVAEAVGVTRARVSQILDVAAKRWLRSHEVRAAADELVGLIRAEQGVVSLDEAAAGLLLRHGSTAEGEDRWRRARGLVRVLVETDARRAEPELVLRQQSKGPVLLAVADGDEYGSGGAASALETAQALVRATRSLLDAHRVVPAATAREALRTLPGADRFTDERLLRLAAAASEGVALSGFHELYRADLDHASALDVTLRGVTVAGLTEAGVRRRVQARFPALPPLPERPALDALVEAALPGVRWDGTRYSRAVAGAANPSSSTHTMFAAESPSEVDGQLRTSLRLSSALVLCAHPRDYLSRVRELVELYGVRSVDVAAELHAAIRALADRDEVPWETVLRADQERRRGAEPSSEWPLLRGLVHEAFEGWWAPLSQEAVPLLLTNAGPLARFELLYHLSTLLDQAVPRPAARWILVPRRSSQTVPVLDGEPVPLGAARWIDLPRESLVPGVAS